MQTLKNSQCCCYLIPMLTAGLLSLNPTAILNLWIGVPDAEGYGCDRRGLPFSSLLSLRSSRASSSRGLRCAAQACPCCWATTMAIQRDLRSQAQRPLAPLCLLAQRSHSRCRSCDLGWGCSHSLCRQLSSRAVMHATMRAVHAEGNACAGEFSQCRYRVPRYRHWERCRHRDVA